MAKQKKTKEDVWYFRYDLAQMHEFLDPENVKNEEREEKSKIYFEIGKVLYILDNYYQSRFDDQVIKEGEKNLTTDIAKCVLKCFKAFIKKSMAGYGNNIQGGDESAKRRSARDTTPDK